MGGGGRKGKIHILIISYNMFINLLDEGWPESVEEYSERYKYEDLIARNVKIDIYDDA